MIKLLSNKTIDKNTTLQELITILLKNRKIPKEEVKEFIYPNFPNPTLPNLAIAVKRIQKAIKNQENILIYGDYDVDGLTATAILWQVLNQMGAQVIPFVPHRHHDGYGFKAKSFFDFQKKKKIKFNLIITVDNGIVAQKELKKVCKIDIIITDHHLPGKKLPKVYTIIHSTKFSGSGISWILAKELDKNASLGLAALGTVADCLPLSGHNRNIVVYGLKELSTNPSIGLKKLFDISGNKKEIVSAYDLAFVLGPRLNAAGRLDDPTDSLRLLCSTNTSQAVKYAAILDKHNSVRKDFEKEGIEKAEKLIDLSQNIFIISDKSFLPGIIGLIAGRLTEKYNRPTIIISQDKEISKASCRSIPEINIIKTLRKFSDLLLDLGGHAQAAGFSIETKNISKFQKKVEKAVSQKYEKIIIVDAEMNINAVIIKNINAIAKLEPFGIGNPKPIFLFKNLKITNKRLLGKEGEHFKIQLNHQFDAIAFKRKDLGSIHNIGDIINIIACLEINTWNGISSPQLIIKEIL
jgi:single-stranded-DNA-specific exonuclease